MADLVSLLFKDKKGATIEHPLGDLILDATIRENHSYSNEVTKFPVEQGFTITDNIKRNPDQLELTGLVTNSPITNTKIQRLGQFIGAAGGRSAAAVAGIAGTAFNIGGLVYKNLKRDGSVNQVELARDFLLDISGRKVDNRNREENANQENLEPKIVTVITGLRVYHNMAMTSLEMPRDNTTGEAMNFTARFIKVQIVKTETVTIPSPNPEVANKTSSTIKKKVNKKVPTAGEAAAATKVADSWLLQIAN